MRYLASACCPVPFPALVLLRDLKVVNKRTVEIERCVCLVFFPENFHNKPPQFNSLKQQEFILLWSSSSNYQRSWLSLNTVKENLLPAFLSTCSGYHNPWHSLACICNPLSLPVFPWPCPLSVSVSVLPLLSYTSPPLDFESIVNAG